MKYKNVNDIINKEFFNSHITHDWLVSSFKEPPSKIGREIKTIIHSEIRDTILLQIRQRLRYLTSLDYS